MADEAPGAGTVSIDDFRRLDLRVGTIVGAKDHPKADRLVIVEVDLGDERRQLVAGLKKYRTTDSLVGRQVVVVTNLPPAVLRGERSDGMLLAVVAGESLALLVPDAEVPPGSRVS